METLKQIFVAESKYGDIYYVIPDEPNGLRSVALKVAERRLENGDYIEDEEDVAPYRVQDIKKAIQDKDGSLALDYIKYRRDVDYEYEGWSIESVIQVD
jgi:hypothetical protein